MSPPQKPSTRGLRIEAVTHNCVKPDLSWIPDGTKVSWRCPVCRRKWTGWANGGIWQGGRASWRYRRREAKRILSAQDTGAR